MSERSLTARWSAGGPQLQSLLRIVAAGIFFLAGTMKLFAFPAGVPPNGGIDPVIFCFIWLYFSAAGGGAWSLDAGRRR